MKDWDTFKPIVLPVGSGKRENRLFGDRALFTLGGSDGFRTRIVPLPSGGQLRVHTKCGMPEYIYEPARRGEAATPDVELKVIAKLTAALADLYMSSGAYTFGPLGGINQSNPMLTIEPVLYKSSSVEGVEASELVQHYEKTPPANGEVSKIYNHTVSPGGLNSPKAAMWNTRPSEFSGLMRRCMQGRYGIGNTSMDMTLPEVGGGINVGSTFGRTTGVLRFGTKYFFVAITSGGGGMYGYYYPLHFPEDVSELMVGSYSEAIDTLCLAHAYVKPEEEAFFGNYDVAYGEPIYYGWIFSLTTNKATCVVNETLAYGYDRRMYRLMSLSFTYDEQTGEVSLSYTLDEEVDGWIAPAIAPIWSPFGGETIWYNMRDTSPTPTFPQNFPVHSFYNRDTLHVVRWQYSSLTKTFDEAAFTLRFNQKGIDASVYGSGSCSAEEEEEYGTTSTHGFSITNGASSVETVGTSFKRISITFTAALDDDPSQPPPPPLSAGFESDCNFDWWLTEKGHSYNKQTKCSPITYEKGLYPPDPRPGNHWSITKRGTSTISNGNEIVDTGSGGAQTTVLVIPAHDCSACYVGYRKTRSISRWQATFSGTVWPAYVSEWAADVVDGAWVTLGEWYPTVYKQVSFAIPSSFSATSSSSQNQNFTEELISVFLQSDTSLGVGNINSEIFYPGALRTKLLQQVQVVSSSLFSDKRYNKDTLSGGETAATSGYPTDISLFVGAA